MNETKMPLPWWRRTIASMPFRVAFGVGIPAAALSGLLFLYRYGNPFVCAFHFFTGLYCPGCGSGRALTALLHGQFLAALHDNVLFVLALPLVAYFLLKQYIRLTFRRDVLLIFSTSWRMYKLVMWGILIFWILRNIPLFPFTLLAPLPG